MTYIDGSLLAKAEAGDWDSITELCEYLAGCFKEKTAADPWALKLLCEILEKIASGQSPDEGFGWKQARKGRRKENTAFRDWDIRMTVRDRMRCGASLRAACLEVSCDSQGEFILSSKLIENICLGLAAETELPFPADIFPLGKNPFRHRGRARPLA